MVTVTNYVVRKRKDDTTFIALEISGSLEIIQSQSSGGFYASVRKCFIPSTFSEEVAKMMIGQQIEGEVVRIQTEPYDYLNKRTGELMTLTHAYSYRPKGSIELIGETRVQEMA